MEAEYNTLSMAMIDLILFCNCVNSVATSVGLDDSIKTCFLTTVWEDNNIAMVLASQEPGCMMPQSKHYGVEYHWFCTHLHDPENHMEIRWIDSAQQKADILTKGLV